VNTPVSAAVHEADLLGGTARLLSDIQVMTSRNFMHWINQPAPVVIAWLFPIMVTAMFAGLFGGAIDVPAGTSYIDFLLPGMLTLAMLFGLETTMTGVTTDAARGVTDRLRSLPMHTSAVVAGRCLADLVNSTVGLALLIAAGVAFGWRTDSNIAQIAAAVGLLLLLRGALLWVGIFIGLKSKTPESVTAVQILVWPIGFLSSVFLDPATMPAWLEPIAQANPLSVTSDAVRELLGSPAWGASSWIDDHAAPVAVGWSLVLVAAFLPLSIRAFRRLGD
jgi:ABC-2 type transport system permease protein